jgi:hypothetical protein
MTRIVAALLALFLLGSIATAQCPVDARYYKPGWQAPSYSTPCSSGSSGYVTHEVIHEVAAPIAVPVLVPATVFQYLPALQPSVAVAVPSAPVAAAPAASTPYTAPGAASAPATTPDLEAIINARVDAALRARSGDRGPPALILPSELQSAAPKPQEPAPMAPPATTGTLDQQVANLLASKSCVKCHTADGVTPVKGSVTLFVKKDTQLFFQPSVSKAKIIAAVSPDATGNVSMPPGGPPLATNETNVLRQWDAQK